MTNKDVCRTAPGMRGLLNRLCCTDTLSVDKNLFGDTNFKIFCMNNGKIYVVLISPFYNPKPNPNFHNIQAKLVSLRKYRFLGIDTLNLLIW